MPDVYEYEIVCDDCGAEYTIGLTVPADRIAPESLAQMLDALHPEPLCGPAQAVMFHDHPKR